MNGGKQPAASEILDFVVSRKTDFVELMRGLTEAESPSSEPKAQLKVRDLVADRLTSLDFRVRRIPGQGSGGMLFASPKCRRRNRPAQLLLGHYDTVWPIGTLRQMPFGVEGDMLSGPGVYDMKGGIAQALLALQAIRHFKIEPALTPLIFLNSDEETGSHESRRYIARIAQCVSRAFVLEPSLGASGRLKTARKGIARFTVTVNGRAAHAGLDPGGGASAILGLSHVIQALFALNDVDQGITVYVGTIDGGLQANVVAPQSKAVVDVRAATEADAASVEQAIRTLRATTPGTSLEIEGGFGRPVMDRTPANRALWRLALSLGTELGLELQESTAGGGSDGNTTSLYTATLDGLGAVGDGAHALHEHLRIGDTLKRAALLALLLLAQPLKRAYGDGGSHGI